MVAKKMVNSNMDYDQSQHECVINKDSKQHTKKSLRLSEKKRLVDIKRVEDDEKKAKDERQKIENEKKEKEEELAAMDLDEDETDSKGKQKRHWESWEKVDKDVFFEAVGEFGKDFDKICAFMDRKTKSRGKLVKDYEPRNKDQIRYFYYRTWKQISKAITLQPAENKRLYHEIYCLICYGELRKKDIRGFGKKDLGKLDELVTHGSTAVRYKGRKIRIKPPTCKFLKKLLEEEEKSSREMESIPENIDVEIYPKSNSAWIAAQCASYNPRIKLNNLPITLKLRSLLKLLNRRFQNNKFGVVPRESLIALFPPKDCTKQSKIDSSVIDNQEPKMKNLQLNGCNSNCTEAASENVGIEKIDINENKELTPSPSNEISTEEAELVIDKTSSDKELTDEGASSKKITCTTDDPCTESKPSPSQGSTSNEPPMSACSTALENDCVLEEEENFFPVTIVDCFEKDLQACYLELKRPSVIRLEYDWQVKEDHEKINTISSFDKLIMLSQRDLCKMKVISQSKTSATAKPNVIAKSSVVSKNNQNNKPFQLSRSKTIVTPAGINVTMPLAFSSIPIVSPAEHISPIFTTTKVPCNPVFIAQTITSPSLKNVSRPHSSIMQRKTGTRLKMIQPASKTLMAKAVAVNFVPQPAQLVQYGQVPPVSAQLINSGAASVSTNLKATGAVTSTTSTGTVLMSPPGSTFSQPSTSALSSPLTIWSKQTVSNKLQGQVQVEVIQEGSGSKTSIKRLHPTAVSVSKGIQKRRRTEEHAGSVLTQGTLETEFDLSFLASGSNENEKINISENDNVNLSSILSGLTKNLCKDDAAATTIPKQASLLVNNEAMLTNNLVKQAASSITVSQSTSGDHGSMTEDQLTVTTSHEPVTRTVLLTPGRNIMQTPTKNDHNSENLREQPVSFGGQWFSDEISEISLGGLLDVGNLKDGPKSSESSQVNDNAVGDLLGVTEKKKKIKSPVTTNSSVLKSFNNDSLIMKPETDPVIAFESLMDENSIDYINKFKDLTAKFKGESPFKQSNEVNKNQQGQTNSLETISKPDTITKVSTDAKDPTLPVYRSEDSVGPLDGLSFVLPVDSNSCDSVKGFS